MASVTDVEVVSHSSAAVLADVRPDGKVYFCVTEYTLLPPGNAPWTSIRHVMETGWDGEKVSATLERGLTEEAAADKEAFSLVDINLSPLVPMLVEDDKYPGKRHLKCGFLVKIEGELRALPFTETGPKGDEVHGTMSWVEANELLDERGSWMSKGRKIRFHEHLVFAALEKLALDPKVAMEYSRLLAESPVPTLSDAEYDALERYLLR